MLALFYALAGTPSDVDQVVFVNSKDDLAQGFLQNSFLSTLSEPNVQEQAYEVSLNVF